MSNYLEVDEALGFKMSEEGYEETKAFMEEKLRSIQAYKGFEVVDIRLFVIANFGYTNMLDKVQKPFDKVMISFMILNKEKNILLEDVDFELFSFINGEITEYEIREIIDLRFADWCKGHFFFNREGEE